MLYTLTPGESSVFKDIRLCTNLCPGTQQNDLHLHEKVKNNEGNYRSQPFVDPFVVLSRELTSAITKFATSAVSIIFFTTLLLNITC